MAFGSSLAARRVGSERFTSWQNKYMVNFFKIGNEIFNAAQIAFVNLDYHERGLKDAVCIYFAFQADDPSADQSATKGPYSHVVANPPDVKAIREYFSGKATAKGQ